MIRILELFGGIGACSKALERLKIPFEIADYVEIDKYAVKSFNAIHGTDFEPQDITTWDKNIEVDLILGGSPCQDFSIAGKQAGGDKGSGTRSSLMYETIRIVEKLKPKYVIWENVKNLLSKRHIHNFNFYIFRMEQLGYTNYYQVLNAKDYGIPQNRERVFTISILGNEDFEFPQKQELKAKRDDYLEEEVDKKYYYSEKMLDYFRGENNKSKYPRRKIFERNLRNTDIARTLTTSGGGRVTDNYVIDRCYLRRLTPKECWRLMGFDDEDFEKAAKVNSNTQLYKQAGNSIVVNVLEAILKKLLLGARDEAKREEKYIQIQFDI